MKDKQTIAIVGMSIFSPAGNTIEDFWNGISQGGDFITDVPADVIDPYHFEGEPNGIDKFYCKKGGFVKDLKIDPLRYGLMPITAEGTDPEQLVSLMGAEQALIDAGIFEKGTSLENCSVIIGRGSFSSLIQMRSIEIMRTSRQITSLLKNVLPDLTEEDLDKVRAAYQTKHGRYEPDMAVGTMPNLIASLIANRFGMQGPAYLVEAACSSGIVAIDHSINLLRSGRSDLAVAGGMHVGHSSMFWGIFDMLGALSRKERIAPFSKDADGLIIGQGVGFVVLKTLDRAIADGDKIYALINDTAICSDGTASHVMVTSTEGQERVLKEAWAKAGMDPKYIGYIEAHGTGTNVGDKNEINSLKNFFGDNTFPRAYVGSVKSNIGHSMPAAGMIGVIKTALSLYHRKIAPTLHCEEPLPAMMESRFMPPCELIDWDGKEIPLVAGVSAFGFGGINAHAILTAHEPEKNIANRREKPYTNEAYMISAKTEAALIEKLSSGDFTDTGGDYRLVLFNPDDKRIEQAIFIVKEGKPCRGDFDIWFTNRPTLTDGGKVVFMYPGFSEESMTETDTLSDSLELPRMDELLLKMGEATENERISQRVYNTKWLCKEGLAKLGVKPDMSTGYSIGEWDAALFDGILKCDKNLWTKTWAQDWDSYEYYFPTVIINGYDRKTVESWCEGLPDLYLACDNSPKQVFVSGKEPSVSALSNILDEKNAYYVIMPQRLGMHTPLVADLPKDRFEFFWDMDIQDGDVPVWSASTLEPVPTEKGKYLEFLIDELTKPVYFADLIRKLYDEQNARVFIQIGLGLLPGYVDETLQGRDFGVISTSTGIRSGADQLRRILALLFIEGREVDKTFVGVRPQYQVSNSLMMLPRGAPDLLTEFNELDEVVTARYGLPETRGGLLAGAIPSTNPLATAVSTNIQEAIAFQREVVQLFDAHGAGAGANSVSNVSADSASGSTFDSATAKSRKGTKFEETLCLSYDDYPCLIDHSIVRQPKDWPVSEDLNPVVPFTMSLELFAEIALKHAPGEKLLKIGNVTAYRWIDLVKPRDITVKGEWLQENVLSLAFGEYITAECTLGNEWPTPPAEFDGDIDIGEEIVKQRPSSEWYDEFSFHGPYYRSSIKQKKICERGLAGDVQRMEGKGSFLDILGQQLGLYLHITQEKDPISFPVRLKEIAFYADIFDQDGIFENTLIINKLTDTVATTDAVLKRDNKVWAVIRSFTVQRFFSTPDLWKVILNPEFDKLAKEIDPGVYFYANELQDNVIAMLAKRYLSASDKKAYEQLTTAKQRREHVISRIALKDAVRIHLAKPNSKMLYPVEFSCDHDDKGKLTLSGYEHVPAEINNLFVSLSHKDFASVAIVSDKPVGIDLENIEEKSGDFISVAFTEKEIELLKSLNSSEAVIRFWVAKEAYAKMKGEGLKGDSKRFEVSEIDGDILTIGEVQIKTVTLEDKYIAGWTI